MTADLRQLMNWQFDTVEQSYSARDAIIYALGVGLGHDPLDKDQLKFVFEEGDFQVLPSMAVVLASPGFWSRDPRTGIVWQKVLHGEQGLEIHSELPSSANVKARSCVTRVLDKGEDKGALIYVERTVYDADSETRLATLTSTIFARGNGGFGGDPGPQQVLHSLPEREPDIICDLPTAANAALLYRMSGDLNPLHADPDVAAKAGFHQPILHGLSTYGVAGHAILKCCCDYQASRLRAMNVRFSSPVFPGETIRTEMWIDGSDVSFRALVKERDKVVLNNGYAQLANQE